jgi:hypothetical protein
LNSLKENLNASALARRIYVCGWKNKPNPSPGANVVTNFASHGQTMPGGGETKESLGSD